MLCLNHVLYKKGSVCLSDLSITQKSNTNIHPSFLHMIVLIIFMDAITLYKMAEVYDLVFHFFTARTET